MDHSVKEKQIQLFTLQIAQPCQAMERSIYVLSSNRAQAGKCSEWPLSHCPSYQLSQLSVIIVETSLSIMLCIDIIDRSIVL